MDEYILKLRNQKCIDSCSKDGGKYLVTVVVKYDDVHDGSYMMVVVTLVWPIY